MKRWRFVDDATQGPRETRVIEVECEPTEGFSLTTGERWHGLHVRARYPLRRDRRWKRCNVVGETPLPDDAKAAAELAALHLLRGDIRAANSHSRSDA